MKTMIKLWLATLVLLPCLLCFNDSDTFIPNMMGITYTILLIVVCHSPIGIELYKAFHTLVIDMNEKIERWLMK
jgi:hypothetical protein